MPTTTWCFPISALHAESKQINSIAAGMRVRGESAWRKASGRPENKKGRAETLP
jgi:hypothetical protein